MTEYLRVEADGTRVYKGYVKYKPIPVEERKYRIRKPDDPRAVRWRGDWLLPLNLMSDSDRPDMPVTRADTEAYEHMATNRECRCDVCVRPAAYRWKLKWMEDQARSRAMTSTIQAAASTDV